MSTNIDTIPDLWKISQIPELKQYKLGGESVVVLIRKTWHQAHELKRQRDELREVCKQVENAWTKLKPGQGLLDVSVVDISDFLKAIKSVLNQ